MKIYYTDTFVLPLPENHRFPMEKYARLRELVTAAGLVPAQNLCMPPAASDEQLLLVHTEVYLDHVVHGKLSQQEIRRMGFPWSPGLVERSRRSVGGTIAACRAALEDGLAANLAGGTHHAYPDQGQGFCVFNDVAVAARVMQSEGRTRQVLVVDTDVHQGNGTAAIFGDDPSVFTFSIHGAKNFPFHKENSDLDIGLEDGTGDEAYLDALGSGLDLAMNQVRADLAIYVSGADAHENDRLGRLALTKAGLAARDQLVLETCRRAGLPVAITMGGGYGKDVTETVAIHFETIRTAARLAEGWRRERPWAGPA